MSDIHIWDSHVHLFPPEIYENWDKYAKIDPVFGSLTARSKSPKGAQEAWVNGEEALLAADKAGVEGMCMQGWYWNDPGLMRLHNDYMAQLLKDHPDRFKAFASVNPKFGWEALSEIERCAAKGFCGIGELGPGGNGYDFNDPDFLAVLEMAQALDLPVCIHCGESVGVDYPGRDRTSLDPLPDIIRRYPDLKLILAHLGGGMPFFEMNRRFKGIFKNVRYDLAALPLLYDIRIVKAVTGLVGSDRVLFGSDFPLLLYPSACREADMTMFIEQIRSEAGLDEDEYRAVMGANFLDFVTPKEDL